MEKASNGQFQELIGKLLVKGSEQKVSLFDKKQIQEKINLLSSGNSGDSMFFSFVDFINESFDLYNVALKHIQQKGQNKICKRPDPFIITNDSVKSLLPNVFEIEKIKGNSEPWVCRDLYGEELPGFSEDFSFSLYRIPFFLTDEQMCLIDIPGKRVFSLLEALCIAESAFFRREMGSNEKGRILVYFREGVKMKLLIVKRDPFQVVFKHYDVDKNTAFLAGDYICFGD